MNLRIISDNNKNDFSLKKIKFNTSIQFNRIAFIFFIFFVIYLIYTFHLIHLGLKKSYNKQLNNFSSTSTKFQRADIIDINGNYLAKTVSSIDVGIKPEDIIDKKKLILNLKYIFPNKDFVEIEQRIEKNKFFKFERRITPDNYEKIMKLGDKSIVAEENVIRLYPQKNLFSHIIGQIDDGNKGISGLEKSLDERLKDSKDPIRLTVDKEIQFLIRSELVRYQEIFKNKGAAALLMNVNNGDIISLVSLPDFDPNLRENITDANYINKVTKGTYELGSVFKSFTYAAALNEELIKPESEFLNLPKTIYCGRFPISEYDEKIPSDLTAEKILIRSGNIGSVRIAEKIGSEKFKFFLEKIGVLGQINFDIEEIASDKNFEFDRCRLETAAFGHGITTTILQLAKGYSILSNGGFYIEPRLIKRKKNEEPKNQILNDGVSEKVVSALRKIVNTEEGTANLADVNGYEIAGKTGTAQQPIEGEYSRAKINTFASVFPSSKPEYVFIVMLDTPKKSTDYVYTLRNNKGIIKGTPFNTAGWTAVEVAAKIIEKIGPILATKSLEVEENDFERLLQ